MRTQHAMPLQSVECGGDLSGTSRLDDGQLVNGLCAQDVERRSGYRLVVRGAVELDPLRRIGQDGQHLVLVPGANMLSQLGDRAAGSEPVNGAEQRNGAEQCTAFRAGLDKITENSPRR